MNRVPPFQLAAEARRIARPHLRLAILCLGAAMLGATPAGAQQLQGSVQQNDTAPSTGGDVFNSQSPEFNSQGPGESSSARSTGKSIR
jgi:hypothetical protein